MRLGRRIRAIFIFVAFSLGAFTAQAATLNVFIGADGVANTGDDILRGVNGVTVGALGTFDFLFSVGNCPTLFDGCDSVSDFEFSTDNAIIALTAIGAAIDGSFFDANPHRTDGCLSTEAHACFIRIPSDLHPDFPLVQLAFISSFLNQLPPPGGPTSGDRVDPDAFQAISQPDSAAFTYAVIAPTSPIPLPAALPLFLTAIAGLGGLGYMRRRKAA